MARGYHIWEGESFSIEYVTRYREAYVTRLKDNAIRSVSLKDDQGRNITWRQVRSGMRSHGVDRAAEVFFALGVA
jgi:hypothetical protein